MPAGSDPARPAPALPALPHTWRPLGTRMVGLVAGIGLAAVSIGAWIALGPSIRAKFSLLDKTMMVGISLLAFVCWYALIRPRVTATEAGLTVVNGYRRRDLEWAQVVAVRLRRGAPWAEMDLADGTAISVMALQASDGDRAIAGVRAVRALVVAHGPPTR